MSLKRTPTSVPPFYDIDVLLDIDFTNTHAALAVIETIYCAIEKRPPGGALWFRPDSALLVPEVAVRDLFNFDMSMNSGFSSCLGYGGGFTCFFRGLRAVRIIGHKKAVAVAERVRDVMVANGITEPSQFEDDNREGADVDWDKELEAAPDFWDQIQAGTRHLDDEWFSISHLYGPKSDAANPSLYYCACAYLDVNRDLLRCRK